MSLAITAPRVLSDAVTVCAHPDDYANRPTLLHLARLVLMSATGATPTQANPARATAAQIARARKAAKPVLRAIRGGLQ